VNDGFGHGAGDEVLRVVARRLRDLVRSADTVARLGGDEFVLLLEATSDDEARMVAAQVVAALEAPVVVAGARVVSRASVGVAATSAGRSTPDRLVHDADQDMYRRKGEPRPVGPPLTPALAPEAA
jgi:diguanylate cyclase (GGDEF)-like protein